MIVPAYNEAADIGETLQAILALSPAAHEVVVIDDGSDDGTCDVVAAIARENALIRLYRHETNLGLSAARNTGIEYATGDITVFLDADDSPASDFVERLTRYYRSGAECVSVDTAVSHATVIGRFADADNQTQYGGREGFWTAAFSCRRELAAGNPFGERLVGSGEDVEFFHRLLASGASYVHARDIVVTRRIPTTVGGFLRQWRGRGRGVPFYDLHSRGLTTAGMVRRRLLGLARDTLMFLLVVPYWFAVAQRVGKSPKRVADAIPFAFLVLAQRTAQRLGELSRAFEIATRGRRLRLDAHSDSGQG